MSALFIGEEHVFVVAEPSGPRAEVTYEQYCLATGEVVTFRSLGMPPFRPSVRRATEEEHAAWHTMQQAIADAREAFRARVERTRRAAG